MGAKFWIFHFFAICSPKTFKIRDFSLFLEFWRALNSKKSKNSKMRSAQVFCNLEKYLCANFQVKWPKNEGGVAISRLLFSNPGQNTVFLVLLYCLGYLWLLLILIFKKEPIQRYLILGLPKHVFYLLKCFNFKKYIHIIWSLQKDFLDLGSFLTNL